jgi:molecular chaperone DnaJ
MEQKRDYYEVLGLSRESDEREIKSSYRRLARRHHPDVNKDDPDAEERFKEIGEAYAVLTDPEKRARYDRFGHEASGGSWPDMADFDPFSIFDMFFGGRSGRRGVARGEDLGYDMAITLEDVFAGAEREIAAERLGICGHCDGGGAQPGTQPETCGMCHGTGQVRRVQSTFFGQFSTVTTCPDCHGGGQYIAHRCSVCGGRGVTAHEVTKTVRIPPGIEDGQRMRYEGEGNAVAGGMPGDLYVRVFVQPHEQFERRGADIVHEQKITVAQASLGHSLEVPTLGGPCELTISRGTQSGESFCLRGKGLPLLRGRGEGDQYVVVTVETPTDLTERQKELLTEFAELRGEELRPDDEGLLGRITRGARRRRKQQP